MDEILVAMFSVQSVPKLYDEDQWNGGGSNAFIVALRVVEGD
jgi:hypothetical protein